MMSPDLVGRRAWSGERASKLVLVGAGGHARVVASLLSYREDLVVVGVADRDRKSLGEVVGGHRVIATWDDLPRLVSEGVTHAALALGDNRERADLFETLRDLGVTIPRLIHPTAFVERGARVGTGAQICAGAILCAEASVGDDAIVNTGAIVEHECRVGRHAHIAPGSVLCGRVRVGSGAFVGAGSRVKEKISIGPGATVGAGSVVLKDIPKGITVAGVPARVLSESKRERER
jgi:UDP-perosamine 4-acetyltransferase